MKLSSALLILLFAILISGCSDTTTNPGPQTRQVSGSVITSDGISISGVTVYIENKTAITNSEGKFSIDAVTSPYDVKLLKTESGFSNGVQYIGLNNFSPKLYMGLNPSGFLSSTINVTIPFSLSANQHGIVIYSDNDNVFAVSAIQSGQSGTSLNPYWTGSSNVNGKLFILIFTQLGLSVSSYDNYGEITFNINAGSIQTKNVTASEISTNPTETTVTGVVNLPTGYSNAQTTLNISPSKGLFSGSTIGALNPGMGFNHVVPSGLSNELSLSIVAGASGPMGKTSVGKVFIQPGASGVQLNILAGADLNTPANNSSGIDTNTIFTYTPVSGGGVYIVAFSTGNRNFQVFTQATSTAIPNFSPFGVGLGNNQNYTWSVFHYNTSIDQFVSTRFDKNPNVTNSSISSSWFFTSN